MPSPDDSKTTADYAAKVGFDSREIICEHTKRAGDAQTSQPMTPGG